MEYTKGHWNYRINVCKDGYYIESQDDEFIADVGGGIQPMAEIKQNAKLISLAPEMYELLEEIFEEINLANSSLDLYTRTFNLIKK